MRTHILTASESSPSGETLLRGKIAEGQDTNFDPRGAKWGTRGAQGRMLAWPLENSGEQKRLALATVLATPAKQMGRNIL